MDKTFAFGGGSDETLAMEIRMNATPLYQIACYETNRVYGGPEEGGWWFTTGYKYRDVESLEDQHEAYRRCNRRNHLVQLFLRLAERPDRYSMAYRGGDFEYRVYEGLAPKHFPEVRPHYE